MTCPNCGGVVFTWGHAPRTLSGVVDGRLRASEVETVFYLGCDECSETIETATPDDITALLNTKERT